MMEEISHINKDLRDQKHCRFRKSAESRLRRSILIFSKAQRLQLVEINNQLIVENRNLRRCEKELLAKEMKKKPEQVQRFINNLRAGLYPRLCQKVLVLKSYEEKNTLFDNIDYFTTPKNMANLMKYLSSGLEKDLDKGPYFNYVSMFLSIFDQLSTLVSIFTTVPGNSYSTAVSILQTK